MKRPKKKRGKSLKLPGQAHHFIAAWMRAPLAVGALVPSSRGLARAVAAQVDPASPGAVVELGAGTGVVTQALLEAGISPEQLIVIERDPKLHAMLSAQFPQLNVVCADAVHLDEVLKAQNVTRVNAVVSGLPLLNMPLAVKRTIEQQMAALAVGGSRVVQFTYGPQSPVSRSIRKQYGLAARRARTVLANIPPAHVWVYEAVSPPNDGVR